MKTMFLKAPGLVVLLLLARAGSSAEWNPALGGAGKRHVEWKSPDSQYTVLWDSAAKPDPVYRLAVAKEGGQTNHVQLGSAAYSKESLGIGNLPDRRFAWIGNRFWASETSTGVGILDVERGRFLVNMAVATYVKSPVKDEWLFVRKRPVPRKGTLDVLAYRDTLGMIGLDPAILKPDDPSNEFVDHTRCVQLEGMVLSPLIYVAKNDSVAFFELIQGKSYLAMYRVADLTLLNKEPIQVPTPRGLEVGAIDLHLSSRLEKTVEAQLKLK